MKNLTKSLIFLGLLSFFIFSAFVYGQDLLFDLDNKDIPMKFIDEKKEEVEKIQKKEEKVALKEIVKDAEKNIESTISKKENQGLRILFVGDSMVEAIFHPSKEMCKKENIICGYVFKRGLRTDVWTKNGWYGINLILKMDEIKPNIVVISSGTNDIYNKETPEEIYRDFKKMIRLIKDVSKGIGINPKIVIVAPPIPNDKNLNQYLERKFKGKKNIYVIRSKYFRLKLWDGIHPNRNSSKIWTKKIFKIIDYITKY